MVFSLADEHGNHSSLTWSYSRNEKKNSFVFKVNGNQHIIEDIQPRSQDDWLEFRIEILSRGIVLFIGGEQVCMVRTPPMGANAFTLQLTTTYSASLKNIYIYEK